MVSLLIQTKLLLLRVNTIVEVGSIKGYIRTMILEGLFRGLSIRVKRR